MLDVIRKKPKVEKTAGNNSIMPRESGNPGLMNSGMNTGMGAIHGYNGGTVQAGGTQMGMQQAPAAFQQPPLQNAQAQGRATYTK